MNVEQIQILREKTVEPGGLNFGNTVVKRESVKIIQRAQNAKKSVSDIPA